MTIRGKVIPRGAELAVSWGMVRDGRLSRWCAIAIMLSPALAVTGCTSGGGMFGSPTASTSAPPPAAGAPPPTPSSPSFTDEFKGLFSRSSAQAPQSVAGAPQRDLDCPLIDIRSGASTLQIPQPTEDQNSTMSLKYQGTFVRAARECALVSGQVVMKIGVEGRIIVGPAGGPGPVEVPLRIAVVSETTAGTQPIATKLIRIPVDVTSTDSGTTFTHVENGVSFPMPPSADLDRYIVYIGFDPLGAEAQDQQKPKPKAKPKPKPMLKPTTG